MELNATIPKSALSLFEGSLSSRIFLCYTSKASEGRFYLDSAPERLRPDREGVLSGSFNAKGHGLLNACVTRDVKSQIRCLGGIKVFLPLFAHVDQPKLSMGGESDSRNKSDPDFMYQIFACLQEMLLSSETNQREFWRFNLLINLNYSP